MAITKRTLHQKLLSFHMEVGTIKKTGNNPHFRSSYADINTVLSAVMPLLTAVGIVLLQLPQIKDGVNVLVTQLIDADNKDDMIESVTPLVMKDITNPQQYGSSITYARRYALVSMLDLETEDDDGNYASQNQQPQQQRQYQQPQQNYNQGNYNGRR